MQGTYSRCVVRLNAYRPKKAIDQVLVSTHLRGIDRLIVYCSMEKYFAWYDRSDRFKHRPYYGPHYVIDINAVRGKNLYHSLSDLMKTSISDSVKKRLTSAKVGTKIKVHSLHSDGNLMLKCIDEEQVKILNDIHKLHDDAVELDKKQKAIELKLEKMYSKIYEKTERY